jgi:hypothetical protein
VERVSRQLGNMEFERENFDWNERVISLSLLNKAAYKK